MGSVTADGNNHISGFSYDAAGNTTGDGTTTYAYDAEGKIATATNSSSGASSYIYDAEGRRVQKTVAGNSVNYLYDLAGNEVTEINSAGGWSRGEIYLGSRHLATYVNSTTYFNHSDWLGTERLRSTVGGATYETCTSLSFGDALSCSASDSSPLHFTGKERDFETGNDDFGARYYSSALGRFASPDWNANPTPIPYANLAYPQSLNLYSYVQNNPLTFRDPNGHCTVDGEKHNWLWCAAHSVGITETKKETAAREKNEAEVREFLRTHPQYLENAILMAASLGTMVALEATNTGAGESNSTVSADEQTAIEAGAAGEAGAARNATNLADLEKSLASEQQVGETGGVIAGTGARVPFRDAARVAQQYGGSASDWVKVSSSSYTARDGTKFETHWVENIKTGQRVEFKTKFP